MPDAGEERLAVAGPIAWNATHFSIRRPTCVRYGKTRVSTITSAVGGGASIRFGASACAKIADCTMVLWPHAGFAKRSS